MVAVPLNQINNNNQLPSSKEEKIMIGLTDQEIENEKIEDLR